MPLFSCPLPHYKGPHEVSTTDLELNVPSRSFGTAKLAKSPTTPALLLESILVTIYHPSSATSSPVPHQSWLERPVHTTIAGYTHFINKPNWLFAPALWLILGGTRLPALRDAPLATSSVLLDQSTSTIDTTVKEMIQVDRTDGKRDALFPTIVFSHGLGGTRTTYSQICGELASHGYVVVAVESRDGTAPATFIHSSDGSCRVLQYYNMTDLVFNGDATALRKEQLLMRLAEVEETLTIMRRINAGEGAAISAQNLRKQDKASTFSFADWAGRLDVVNDITIAGHSFGAATAIQVLRAGPNTFPFVQGIGFDPWVDPIPHYEPSPSPNDIAAPLLVINSEEFTLWGKHFLALRDIVRGILPPSPRWLLTLVGSIHQSFSDFPIIVPFLMRRSGARVDPLAATHLFVDASLEFLRGQGTSGTILGQRVVPGDEDGARPGEGGKYDKGEPMPASEVGQVRMHIRPV